MEDDLCADDPGQLTIAALQRRLQQRLRQGLTALGLEDAATIEVELVAPPDPALGDYGYACFPLARRLRKAPPLIAQELASAIPDDGAVIERASAAGPYVNLKLRPSALVQVVVGQVLREREGFGAGQADPPEHWMVEYSSPNTNKPLHLGHLRNNLLGAAVAAILRHHGHRVTRINLVNDRGVHICKSMVAYRRWGEGNDPERAGKKGDRLVGELYVEFDRRFRAEFLDCWLATAAGQQQLAEFVDSEAGRAAITSARERAARDGKSAPSDAQVFFDEHKDGYFNSDSELGAEVRQMLRAWEAGDDEVRALWRRMNGWVLEGFEHTYRRMGVGFDQVQYESETYRLGKALVAEGLDAGALARRDDGAVVCDLSRVGMKGEKVLLRGDGTSVYMTQDLGTAVERFEQHALDRLVYVVGDEQQYHFEVLFKVLGLLRPGLDARCRHLAYGMIRLPEGRMKSREGKVVDADDLMQEMHRLARAETEQRAAEGKAHTGGIDCGELELRAERIGMAALKYFLLKYSPRKSFVYDPEESIDFLGQTGPYCLFNYARTRSLLRRAGGEPAFDARVATRLGTERELEIVRLVGRFPEVVSRAVAALDPSRIAEHCFELCKSFAFVFTDKDHHPIVTCEDAELRQARLMLASVVGHTLRTGLGLLGIEVLEEM